MKYGIRLTGTERDLAALHALAERHADLVVATWTALSTPGSAATVLTSPRLELAAAKALRARGLDVVRLQRADDGLAVTPLEPRALQVGERWTGVLERDAPSLVEAVAPVRAQGDPPCEEALLLVPVGAEAAQRTLERLLSLRRDDFTVAELDDRATGERALLLRVPQPPMYLLLRAREEPDEGVTAFARVGGGGVWVEWSWAQPLAHVVARHLAGADRMALVTRDGRWRFVPASMPVRSVYDVVVPRFEARHVELTPSPGESRFTVRLRLGAAPTGDPELWVLDPGQLLALEPLVESLSQEELSRFTVARATGPEGTRYVLQEIVRPGVARLGVRVSDLVSSSGYARVAGTDNLYLPPGRQLLPRMRRDELRALLGLDRARLVVVAEDLDGPWVTHVAELDEQPLSRWVDYVATDRRTELERLDEQSVFDWPVLDVEAPAKKRREDKGAAQPAPAQPPRVRREEPRARPQEAPRVEAAPADDGAELAALREAIRKLERVVAKGGHDDPATWAELAALDLRVDDVDNAAACLESAMFFGDEGVAEAASLASLRARVVGAAGTREEAVSLVTKEHLAPGEAAYLGARVLEYALRGETVVDDSFYQQAERRLTDPEALVSRRLAWVVARALHRRTGDRLGATRARERILGGMNDRGLSDTTDTPRFVRLALAFEAGDEGGARARDEQLTVLESLWSLAQERHVRELEPKGAYLRLAFAVGFARLGAGARGRDLLEAVEAEEGAHEAPNRKLFELYRLRYAFAATQADPATWRGESEAVVATIKEPKVRDRVDWIRKRSEWLRPGVPDDQGSVTKPAVERALSEAEATPELAPATLARLADDRALFDFEVRVTFERLLRAGLRSGNDELLAEVLRVASGRINRVNIAGHRAGAIGACIRAAATLGDGDTVDRMLGAVVALAEAPEVPSARDLLLAVNPGLAALRRLGVGASARRFLDALLPVAKRGQREGVKLRAAIADGYLQLRDEGAANQLIDQCVTDTLEGGLDHVGRYDACVAVLVALRHWPMVLRERHCATVLGELDRFTDAYTASLTRLYETHKILLGERLVDAVVDDVTLAGDRVRQWLDEEEQATRRRVLADWRQLCGR